MARIAAGQRTLVTTEQLNECSLGKDAIAYRVGSGRLHVVFRGVYSVGCGELPPLARELAALLACGERSFLSHRSAAFVWGMLRTQPEDVELSVVGRCLESRTGIRVHRLRGIEKRDLRRHEGLRVSSPARATLEVAAVGTREELVEAVDEGLARRRFTPRDLQLLLARNRGRRGAGRIAELLGDETAMAISRSQAEKAFLRLIRDSGLAMPETNVRIGGFEADFLWREQRLVVELDTVTYHSGPGVFQRDREKALVFRDAGLDTMRFTREHAVNQPTTVLVRVTQALAARQPPPPGV